MKSPRWALGLERGPFRVLLALSAWGAAVGFLPLFGGPGYESALALGLTLPAPVACTTALAAARPKPGGAVEAPLAALTSAGRFALLVLVTQLASLLLHGARAGFCDVSSGLLSFALGPATGTLLAAGFGTAAGLLVAHARALGFIRSRRVVTAWAVALALSGPLGGVFVSLWRYWSSPMIFAFDPFAGFFAGTLYDTIIDALPRLLTYRAGSFGSALALVCLCALAERDASGRVRLPAIARRWGIAVIGGAGAALALGVALAGPALGHHQTTATIERALGGKLSRERCEILYDTSIGRERAELLARECQAHLEQQAAYFETAPPPLVRVFAFASARQKGHLMGASRTYIAKPWRAEVYIQNDTYPHSVLGHELAHVMAGTFGQGPFAVAGPLAGLWPDPGRIEGFAVAASPPDDSDFTLRQWTRAVHDLDLLPRLGSLFRMSFLGQNSSTAYTVAGAVVEWLRERHGPAALRAWYGGSSIEHAFAGKSLAQLEREFLDDLAAVSLPEGALELARARFDRPAIFGRRCPHEVDRNLAEAEAALQRLDFDAAVQHYRRSLSWDPQSFTARTGLAVCDQRRGEFDEARSRYQALARDPQLTAVQRSVALERLGDLAQQTGATAQALEFYALAERQSTDEHRARTLEVKRYGLEAWPDRKAIGDLLIGDAVYGSDVMQSSAALGAWAVRDPELGMADYLLGKNLHGRSRWREAHAHLGQALARTLPLASVRREALRSRVFVACALGETAAAAQAWRELSTDPGLSLARKNGMQRFAAACGVTPSP